MNLSDAAYRQLADYDRHQPGMLFADDTFRLTVDQAYDLQGQVAALRQGRGEAVAGYKVGCVSESVRQQLGLSHPVYGRVFGSELHESGCVLDETAFAGLAIEGEFAVRLGKDGAAASIFPVIELHNYVLRSVSQPAQELIANNGIHAGVVLSAEEFAIGSAADSISVWINEEVRGSAECNFAETAAASLRFLAKELERFNLELRPGQIVLTGSPLPLYRVKTGDRIAIRCGGFRDVNAAIRPPY